MLNLMDLLMISKIVPGLVLRPVLQWVPVIVLRKVPEMVLGLYPRILFGRSQEIKNEIFKYILSIYYKNSCLALANIE